MNRTFSSYLPEPHPVAFTLLGIDIMWYGILIAAGIVLAAILIYIRAESHGIKPDRTLDMLLICLPLGIIGARVYYVFFEWDYYAGDLMKMINTREGGLAIHGGLLFGLTGAAILCHRWSIRPLNLLDLAAPSIALAQSIGRWGNYFNSEAHGGPTDLPWGIPINGEMVHPTFLYESVWCFLLFVFLILLARRRSFEGQIFLLYGILYSIERFLVEGLRTDSLMLGPFRQAQLLSLTIILIFTAAYFILKRRHPKNKTRSARQSRK